MSVPVSGDGLKLTTVGLLIGGKIPLSPLHRSRPRVVVAIAILVVVESGGDGVAP